MKSNGADNNFHQHYAYLWGTDHFSVNPQGTEVQLKMDKYSGAGFKSKLDFGSGSFHIKLKTPDKKTRGIVTSFYLTSDPDDGTPAGNHFELDFEFWGTDRKLQTNVLLTMEGTGSNASTSGLIQPKTFIWFLANVEEHKNYDLYSWHSLLSNVHASRFLVDNIPIRVFKNNTDKGVAFPNKSLHVDASIWNAPFAGPVTWSEAPFVATYQDFGLEACSAPPISADIAHCSSQQYFWNKPEYGS
ncbi:Xyloglucan endotransglucosylase/hydrolase protein 2 precursor [Dorcoceras hygrometricum]|uniref:Xyloglucan endotransglucosylase/hydrolase protein 2 n=1 Tax=Dorcoceras hygrometricum TaxID=472368 RepID=A0A2Z7AG11_9LAMI|nr:Xyloglucan endotransglucosylase/hydrolase protein 2 precursor [Dorcoceras hygrometricum]